jgi:hypothetical protein
VGAGATRPAPSTFAGPDQLTWAVVVGTLILVVAGIVTAVLADRMAPAPDLTTPTGVTLAYELAIQQGEGDRAWSLLSSSAQASTTRQEFLARAASASGWSTNARLSVEDVRVEGTVAHLDLVRTFPTDGPFGLGTGAATSRNPVTLDQEDGVWRITVPPEPWVIMKAPTVP